LDLINFSGSIPADFIDPRWTVGLSASKGETPLAALENKTSKKSRKTRGLTEN